MKTRILADFQICISVPLRLKILSNREILGESQKIRIIPILLVMIIKQRRTQNPVKHLRWSFFPKIGNGFQLLTIFAKSSSLDFRISSEYTSNKNPNPNSHSKSDQTAKYSGQRVFKHVYLVQRSHIFHFYWVFPNTQQSIAVLICCYSSVTAIFNILFHQ